MRLSVAYTKGGAISVTKAILYLCNYILYVIFFQTAVPHKFINFRFLYHNQYQTDQEYPFISISQKSKLVCLLGNVIRKITGNLTKLSFFFSWAFPSKKWGKGCRQAANCFLASDLDVFVQTSYFVKCPSHHGSDAVCFLSTSSQVTNNADLSHYQKCFIA